MEDPMIKLEELLHYASRSSEGLFVLHLPTPDALSSLFFLRVGAFELGIPISSAPCLPEDVLFAVGRAPSRDRVLLLLGLTPFGPGPVQVASELFDLVVVLDRVSHYPPQIRQFSEVIAVSAPLSEVTMSTIRRMGRGLEGLDWIGRIGGTRLSRGSEGLPDPSLAAYELMLHACFIDPEVSSAIAPAALEEAWDEPEVLLSGVGALSGALSSLAERGHAKLRQAVESAPRREAGLPVWFVDNPWERWAIAEAAAAAIGGPTAAAYDDGVTIRATAVDSGGTLDIESAASLTRRVRGSILGTRYRVEISARPADFAEVLSSLVRAPAPRHP
ncbi:MAG: hypothetical protein DRO06_01405 [Thermoproteota archaeon]|nr:MAG: hypothetical protein DRO06_01405 [Candidatus Korarchaeota archaeon]